MNKWAIFLNAKAAADFVAKIDALYGFPNADAKTYAYPEQCKDGTYMVKIKDWLRLPIASASKPIAIAECAKLPAENLKDVKPEPMVVVAVPANEKPVGVVEGKSLK